MQPKKIKINKLFAPAAKYTTQKVLITVNGADKALTNRAYFDRILTCKDLFDKRYW